MIQSYEISGTNSGWWNRRVVPQSTRHRISKLKRNTGGFSEFFTGTLSEVNLHQWSFKILYPINTPNARGGFRKLFWEGHIGTWVAEGVEVERSGKGVYPFPSRLWFGERRIGCSKIWPVRILVGSCSDQPDHFGWPWVWRGHVPPVPPSGSATAKRLTTLPCKYQILVLQKTVLIFHKEVKRKISGVVGSFINTLLQIYCWVCQWKKCENRPVLTELSCHKNWTDYF